MSRASLLVGLLAISQSAFCWDGHGRITQLSLSGQREWPEVSYEPIEKALPDLALAPGQTMKSQVDLVAYLKINESKIRWDWAPAATSGSDVPAAFQAIAYSSDEVDLGMDQDLNISPDQKYMGGYSGLSSQGIRHMYYQAWNFESPIVTFHFPIHEMGMAIERATRYFSLASEAKKKGHLFWAYRFLGWGMHYVQDLGQPYHTRQFASFRLLPWRILLKNGWDAFVEEATRIVSNYHLSFEDYVHARLEAPGDPSQNLLIRAFELPSGSVTVKQNLEGNLALKLSEGLKILARASAEQASEIVCAEERLAGKILKAPGIDLRRSPTVLDWSIRPPSPELDGAAARALSDVGVATRWYFDRFKRQ